ncbi:extracellular solute-binding protein [Paenibacillus humicola]|uniref:extracellular solute-binding protein n=1 Tax=Paenibacillus humicola TaxID=3110540 RepID=UPI00237B2C64|nr:extracellular solute-binding protein [Paenibacillus humicola]
MLGMVNKGKRAALGLGMAFALTALAGCGGGGEPANKPGSEASGAKTPQPFKISVMIPSFQTTLPKAESSNVWKKIEAYTNTKLDINFVPNSSYSDKMNITLASGSMPMVIEADPKSPSIISAIQSGAFWEIGPYLKDYPNLSKANPTILNNISIEGKIYGIYRGRTLGRNGIVYRKDWLDNVGLQPPKTIDDFYNMLKAFTLDDPDKDGKNDTYGMVVTKFSGPWDNMQVWFGVPNKWGLDANGKLEPAHLFPQYMDALKFFRKLYSEKLVNSDFAVMDSAKWLDPVVNGQAGVIVDVADNAGRLEQKMATSDPKAVIDVTGSVEGPDGALHNLPTSGYSGMFLISKSSVKTEDDLKKVLTFLDKMNDDDVQLLAGYGIEGVNYNIEDGKLVQVADDNPKPEDAFTDLNQLLMFIPEDPTSKMFKPATPLRAKVSQVQKENEKIIVPNPAEPLISKTYMQKGAQLDNIIEDARIKFIVGQIDEAGFQSAVELWKKSGGDEYIKEINEAYAKAQAADGK